MQSVFFSGEVPQSDLTRGDETNRKEDERLKGDRINVGKN
jgi:hypothetical protein